MNTATTADTLADTILTAGLVTRKPLVIQAKASQSANLLEIQASTGAVQTSVGPTGVVSSIGPGQFAYAAATNATTQAGSYFSTPKNTVSLFLGDGASTAGYTASEYSANLRWNGAAVAWGDIGYFPTGGASGTYGHFRFTTTGGTVGTTPNAKVGVGDLYVASNVGVGTMSPVTKLNIIGSTDPASEVGTVTLGSGATAAKKLTFGFSDTFNLGWIQGIHSGVAWLNTSISPNGGNILLGTTVSSGLVSIGTNTTGPTNGIFFGTDVNLYRQAANVLFTDDTFNAAALVSRSGIDAQNGTMQNSVGAVSVVAAAANPQILFYGGGTEYGRFNASGDLVLATVLSVGATPATTGVIRIPNAQWMYARNAANNGNVPVITVNGSNNTLINTDGSGIQFLSTGASVNLGILGSTLAAFPGGVSGTVATFTYAALGTNPAGSGALRIPNEGVVKGRNFANSADYALIKVGSDNNVYVSDSVAQTIIAGTTVVTAGAVQVNGAYLAVGANPSTAGYIRLPNAGTVQWRNVANTSDSGYIAYTSGNVLNLVGDTLSLTASNNTITVNSQAVNFNGDLQLTTANRALYSNAGTIRYIVPATYYHDIQIANITKVLVADTTVSVTDALSVGKGTTTAQATTSTASFQTTTALTLTNTNNTVNNWTEMQFNGTGGIAAGIASRNLSHASQYGELWFYSRSAAGWFARMRIPSTGGLEIYGNAGTVVYTVSNTGLLTFGAGAAGSFKGLGANDLIWRNFAGTADVSVLWSNGNTTQLISDSTVQILAAGVSVYFNSSNISFPDAYNVILGTTTGTKIGTATSQKLALWNATPIVQPTTSVAAATFVANTGTAVNDASTFDGYTMKQVVKALRNIGALA